MHPLEFLVLLLQASMSRSLNVELFLDTEIKTYWRDQAMCLLKTEVLLKPIIELGGKTAGFKPEITSVFYQDNLISPAQEILDEYLKLRSTFRKDQHYTPVKIRRVGKDSNLYAAPYMWFPHSSRFVVIADNMSGFQQILQGKFMARIESNSGSALLIVYNGPAQNNDPPGVLDIVEMFLQIIYDKYGVYRVVFMIAAQEDAYEVFVLNKHVEDNCRRPKARLLGNCTRGLFSFNLGAIIDSVNPLTNPNCTLTVCYRTQDPYVSTNCSSGMEVDLMHTIAESVHPKWNKSCSTMNRGIKNSSGEWTEFLGDAMDKQCDLIVGGLYPDNELRENFGSTRTYFMENYVWVIKTASDRPAWQRLLSILSPALFLALSFTLLLMSLLWYIFQNIWAKNSYHREFGYAMIQSIALVFNQSVKLPTRVSQQILFATLAVCMLVTTTSFTSQMVRSFKNPGKQHQISTIEEVIEKQIPFGGAAEQRDWFLDDPAEALIYENYNFTPQFLGNHKNLWHVAAGEIVILTNDKLIFSSLKSFKLYLMPKIVFRSPLEALTLKSSPLNAKISMNLDKILESGIADKILKDFVHKTLQKQKASTDVDGNPIVLRLEHFTAAFGAVILGFAISFVVFICETERIRYDKFEKETARMLAIRRMRDKRRAGKLYARKQRKQRFNV